jgi:hypothetical protein
MTIHEAKACLAEDALLTQYAQVRAQIRAVQATYDTAMRVLRRPLDDREAQHRAAMSSLLAQQSALRVQLHGELPSTEEAS